MTHRTKRGCALTDVWCLILPATRAAINVENYSADNFDIEACTRYGNVTIAESVLLIILGAELTILGQPSSGCVGRSLSRQSKTRDGALGVSSMRQNEGRKAVVFYVAPAESKPKLQFDLVGS
jgi:hypothetical protein